jgi:hypothetical protein
MVITQVNKLVQHGWLIRPLLVWEMLSQECDITLSGAHKIKSQCVHGIMQRAVSNHPRKSFLSGELITSDKFQISGISEMIQLNLPETDMHIFRYT